MQFTAPPVVVTPDVMEVKIEDGDEFLVVASDGLWEVMTRQDPYPSRLMLCSLSGDLL